MDLELLQDAFQKIHCAKESRVQYFDTWSEKVNDEHLDENELLERIQDIHKIIQPSPSQESAVSGRNSRFILFSANGDCMWEDRPLEVSSKVLHAFIDTGIFPPHLITLYQETQSHFSHRVEYDVETDTPIAVYVLLRVPRVGRVINVAIRICLPSLTTIALLSSRTPKSVAAIRLRCIRQSSLLQAHPLHLLNFVLERRRLDLEEWIDDLWEYVNTLERKTGIGSRWSAEGGGVRGRKLESEEYAGLLQDLHSVIVELRLALGTTKFAADLGGEYKKTMQRFEELRKETGGQEAKKSIRAAWDDQVDFNETVIRTTMTKFGELIDRVQAQINVTYSLIAQKSSEQNIQIAKLTAQDSRTMKTITVLTLVFLPSTMLASLWDAGIFTLDPDKSWRVYVGVTCGLTILVFALWFLYVWVTRTRATVSVAVDEEAKRILVEK